MEWLLGSIGFILFLIYDWNDVKWNKRWMKSLFPIGCFCVLGGSVLAAYRDTADGFFLCTESVVSIVLAAICLGLLIYTLFFALPFEDSYVEAKQERSVCREGMYAICRHPGIIWFFLLFLFGGIAFSNGTVFRFGMLMSVWNLTYVIFQDRYSFPKMFSDYEDYKRETPFLIPNKTSILRGISTWKQR